jgi:tetrahydromethanopterin S-methyltransferase subunit G
MCFICSQNIRDEWSDLGDVKTKLTEHDKRFDSMDKRLDTLTAQVTYSFGMAGMAKTHVGVVDNRVDSLEDWKKQVERAQAELACRLARVEEKV